MADSKEVSQTYTSIKDRELIIKRTFRAPRELVLATWTDPAHLEQ